MPPPEGRWDTPPPTCRHPRESGYPYLGGYERYLKNIEHILNVVKEQEHVLALSILSTNRKNTQKMRNTIIELFYKKNIKN